MFQPFDLCTQIIQIHCFVSHLDVIWHRKQLMPISPAKRLRYMHTYESQHIRGNTVIGAWWTRQKRREAQKLTAPIRQGCTRWFAQLSFGLLSYLKWKTFACLIIQSARQYVGNKKGGNNVLLFAASNGWWWLHEASPCNCWINHPADENREEVIWRVLHVYEENWKHPEMALQFTWVSSFLFLFPRALEPEMLFRIICQGSRRQTPAESPSFFSSSSFNNLALRLFPFPDISGTCSSSSLLWTKTRDGEAVLMAVHLH